MQTQWIEIRRETDQRFDGYLALPPAGTGPGLVLFQEIFGVNDHIRAVAEQFALAGFVVLAPDMFWRAQTRVELGYGPDDMEKAGALMLQCTSNPKQIEDDILTTVSTLRARAEVSNAKVGSVGYCMGGRLAFIAASLGAVEASVSYYGGRIQNHLNLAEKITCPMQFHYAERDSHIPKSAVEAVQEAMDGKNAEIFVYPNAEHGFNCWARNSYHPASAALALGRTTTLLAKHLF